MDVIYLTVAKICYMYSLIIVWFIACSELGSQRPSRVPIITYVSGFLLSKSLVNLTTSRIGTRAYTRATLRATPIWSSIPILSTTIVHILIISSENLLWILAEWTSTNLCRNHVVIYQVTALRPERPSTPSRAGFRGQILDLGLMEPSMNTTCLILTDWSECAQHHEDAHTLRRPTRLQHYECGDRPPMILANYLQLCL